MGGCCSSSRKAQLHGTPVYYYGLRMLQMTMPMLAGHPKDGENEAGKLPGGQLLPKLRTYKIKLDAGAVKRLILPFSVQCSPALGEQESLPLSHGAASTLAAGLLVDLNLEMPMPDTYRPPPAPMPFDVVLGRPQTPAHAEVCVGSKCDAGTVSESLKPTINAGGFDNSSKSKDNEKSNCKALADFLLDSPSNSEDELSKSNITAMDEEDVCPICLEEYDLENPEIVTKCEHHFHLSCILEWMERSGACPVCDQVSLLRILLIRFSRFS
ncbi:Zinc finger, RING-type [Dillenia turbinata]|uniref:RING-type E3 ubiquitin transferase n=1 Tax=Dillenia turbinata TaxID=194707 RepID=A0AAN8USF1_9MAGN